MQAQKEQTLVIGIIRSSFGVAGKFKVESTSGECEHFFKLDEVSLRKNAENGNSEGSPTFEQTYKVESVEGNINSLIMKLKGIESPEQVKMFQGAEISVPRDKACPLKENEFYVEDLKQCKLVYFQNENKTKQGLQKKFDAKNDKIIEIGFVTDVLEGGSGNLLEVELTKDDKAESLDTMSDGTDKNSTKRVLIPYNKEFIGTVDIKDKVIQLMHLWILE